MPKLDGMGPQGLGPKAGIQQGSCSKPKNAQKPSLAHPCQTNGYIILKKAETETSVPDSRDVFVRRNPGKSSS